MFDSSPIWSGAPPTLSCHAATVADLGAGRLLAAWFGGTHEGHPDVSIWLSRYDGARWSAPAKIAAEPGVPLWNPVLFRDAAGVIWLFYKAGPNVPAWSGLYRQSRDAGHTWSDPVWLPAGLTGPVKNKPITLSNGDILCGASAETWRNWTAWAELSADGGRSWTRHGPITAPADIGRGDPLCRNSWGYTPGCSLKTYPFGLGGIAGWSQRWHTCGNYACYGGA